jgi:DNA-directed RNA polymerase specialized sigma24 family protein
MLTIKSSRDAVADVKRRLEAGKLTLDEAADALLAATGQLGRTHGTYTEKQLARRNRLDRQRLPRMQHDDVPDEVSQYLVDQRLDGLVAVAGLKPIEEICFRLRFSNMTPREITQILGIGRRRTELHLKQARRKMIQVYKEGPYAGWFEVYLSEVRRGRHS